MLGRGKPIAADIAAPDLLDGGPPDRARLDREAPARPHPEPREPRGRVPRPRRGTRGHVVHAVAGGIGGIAYDPARHRAGAHERQRPVRPGVQGQDRDAHRDARLGRPHDVRDGQRPGRGEARRRARGPRQDRGGPQQRPDPQVHRQRVPAGSVPRRARGLRRLVGRHLLARVRPGHPLHRPRRGGTQWFDAMVVPKGAHARTTRRRG